jgi:hypothetical protein
VSPLLIGNDDVITVTFSSTAPAALDFIAAFAPDDDEIRHIDISQTSPVKFGLCSNAHGYLTTGKGSLKFEMTNLRSDIVFYYFTGGVFNATKVADFDHAVKFVNKNEPLRNRLIPTGDPNRINLLWSTKDRGSPMLQWGLEPGKYVYTSQAKTDSISKSKLCGAPANQFGYHDLGKTFLLKSYTCMP